MANPTSSSDAWRELQTHGWDDGVLVNNNNNKPGNLCTTIVLQKFHRHMIHLWFIKAEFKSPFDLSVKEDSDTMLRFC